MPYYLPPYQQNQCCGQNYYNPYNYICGARPCSITIVINKKPEDDNDDDDIEDSTPVPVEPENDDATSAVASVYVDTDGDGDAEAGAVAVARTGNDIDEPQTIDENDTPDVV